MGKSAIVHCEIETIHPFADGNGRIGRLWQTLILAKWNEVFAWIPMESLIEVKAYRVMPPIFMAEYGRWFKKGAGGVMILETKSLILRPWKETDAESLYEYAKNPLIGPTAGWPVHTSVLNSRQIIRDILSVDETYAVTVKGDDTAIGSIGLITGDKSNLDINVDEAEIGYWIGEPFWGRGLIPEAAREIIRYAFSDLKIATLWCGYFDGNEKSKRVNEKCGFRFHHTEYNKEWPLINAVLTQHVTCMTKEDWMRGETNLSLPKTLD